MKITMIGAGYVGLVSGVCFSDFGHDVVCVEKNPDRLIRTRMVSKVPMIISFFAAPLVESPVRLTGLHLDR